MFKTYPTFPTALPDTQERGLINEFCQMSCAQNPGKQCNLATLQLTAFYMLTWELTYRKLQTKVYAPHLDTDTSNLALSIHSKNLGYFSVMNFT